MDLDALYTHLLSKKGATETFPFGPQALVLKVIGKMYALLAPDEIPPRLTLKCDPERAVLLRDRYAAVAPGYHMNKRHWNTITLDGEVPAEELTTWVDHSYALVVANLTKADRERVRAL